MQKILSLLLISILMLFNTSHASFTIAYPDTCLMEPLNRSMQTSNYYYWGSNYRVYKDSTVKTEGLSVPIVLITNGNGYGLDNYRALAEHLARNGFITINAKRPSSPWSIPAFIDKVIKRTMDDYGIKHNSPVGLIGHSVGGEMVVNAAKFNQSLSNKLNLQGVMTIAPKLTISHYNRLNASHTPAYFTLYGSQDNDVKGINGSVRESFASFSWAATEYTTYSQAGGAVSTNLMDKSMVFVHGADHGGLVGNFLADSNYDTHDEYISTSDQLCITKGYSNAFMRWRLKSQTLYRSYLNGDIIPNSIKNIKSSSTDFMANPISTPIRMRFQDSPKYRFAIENFEDNDYNIYFKSSNILLTKLNPSEHSDYPHYIRDFTNSLLMRWKAYSGYQYLAFNLDYYAKFSGDYKHLSIRLGQLWNGNLYYENDNNGMYGNGLNQSEELYIGLRDKGGRFSWHLISIEPNDKRNNTLQSVGKTELTSYRIPLTAFSNIDRNNLQAVYLAFKPNTEGSMVIDNIEWVR